NLYRVSLNTSKAFAAHNLKIAAEDLDLTLPQGSVYISDIEPGVTGLVLLGRGTLDFHPPSMTEKGQLKIFCGAEALDTTFDAAFVRLNRYDCDSVIDAAALQPKTVDARELRRAQDVFREESQKSFVIDLGDLSRDAWSMLPGGGDFVAEVRTRKYDTLTYAHSSAEAEDITLFDRKRHHNIALYASKQKLATRGRFYNEDDLVDYDVLHYDIDVAASPDRLWIDGKATLRIKVRSYVLGTLSLRLADPLVVQSIVSYEYGRLVGIRVKNQNTTRLHPPAGAARRRRADGDDRVRRPPRAADAGSRSARARSESTARRRHPAARAGGELSLQQPQLLVSAGAGERLRDGANPAVGAADDRLRRERRARAGLPDAGHPAGIGAAAQAVRVQRDAAAALSRVRDEPLRASRNRDGCVSDRGQRPSARTGRRRHPRAGIDLSQHQPVDRGEPAAAAARTRSCRSRRSHRAVLRVADRRRAVFELHRRTDRERSARRPQPRILRRAQSTAADVTTAVAERSGGVQRLPRLLHRARARASVVGPGSRVAQLPRAVDQCKGRPVLRPVVRAASDGRRRLPRGGASDAGAW